MNSKRLILSLAVASVLLAAGIAWTEYTHRPQTIVVPVVGMSCEGCALSVQESLAKLPGASDVTVSVEKAEATLTVDGWSKTTRDDINAAIETAGYKVGK